MKIICVYVCCLTNWQSLCLRARHVNTPGSKSVEKYTHGQKVMWCRRFGQQIHECLYMLTVRVHRSTYCSFQWPCCIHPPKFWLLSNIFPHTHILRDKCKYGSSALKNTLDFHASKVDPDGVNSMSVRHKGRAVNSMSLTMDWAWHIASIVSDFTP